MLQPSGPRDPISAHRVPDGGLRDRDRPAIARWPGLPAANRTIFLMRLMDVLLASRLLLAIAIVSVLGTGLLAPSWRSARGHRLCGSCAPPSPSAARLRDRVALGESSMGLLSRRRIPRRADPAHLKGTPVADAVLSVAACHFWRLGAQPRRRNEIDDRPAPDVRAHSCCSGSRLRWASWASTSWAMGSATPRPAANR
jgi:hypothetical protein